MRRATLLLYENTKQNKQSSLSRTSHMLDNGRHCLNCSDINLGGVMRIKQVFKSNELCHIFNSQSQPKGRTPSGNLYFEDNKIWSYGSHYLLGQIFSKENAVLINNNVYSVTTRGQIADLESSTTNRIQFSVPNTHDAKSSVNTAYLESRVFDSIENILSCRPWLGRYRNEKATRDQVNGVRESIKTLALYCKTFKIKNTLQVPESFLSELTEIALANDLKSIELKTIRDARPITEVEAEKEKRRLAKELIESKKQTELKAKYDQERLNWLNGDNVSYPRSYNEPVRLRIKDDEIQTSQGASVPLVDAIALFRAIESGQAKQGDSVGVYEFNTLNNEQEIVIGCHRIDIDEARRVLASAV